MARVLLCGDVMTGRGVDQALPHPGDPRLWERWTRDARQYLALAEQESGPVPRPMPLAALWGDALAERERLAPDAFAINLETSITARGEPWPKGINYRMHPANVGCIAAARVDVCSLANNHVLDFGREGLRDTLDTLAAAGIRTCGAGSSRREARAPVAVPLRDGGRLLVVGVALADSGVPSSWAATASRSGVWQIDEPRDADADAVVAALDAVRRPGDLAAVSVHWGDNWGYDVPASHVGFAHRLIDGGVDLVHGHSSHHPRPVEVYRDRLVLYGCGDFLNDYEGIRGYEAFRPELTLLWLATLDPSGALAGLEMTPFRVRRLSPARGTGEEARWLAATLSEASRPFGVAIGADADARLGLVGRP